MVNAALQISDPKPKLNYSWKDTTFTFSKQLEWENDTISTADSGNYTEVTSSLHYEYRHIYNVYIKENRTITHTANYSSTLERVRSGNASIAMNMDAYQVNIDYGSGVKLIWIALKGGTFTYENFIQKDVTTYIYREQYNRHIVSYFEERKIDTDELVGNWTVIEDVPGEVNTTVSKGDEWYPFKWHVKKSEQLVKPIILTIQLFETAKNDRIAWAHLFYDFFIYKDKNRDSILTVHDNPDDHSLPYFYASTELVGNVYPQAFQSTGFMEDNETVFLDNVDVAFPSDKSLEEIIAEIQFSPPVETPSANISWGITYPHFPMQISFSDSDRPPEDLYQTPYNATYTDMSPTNLSYGFDFLVSEEEANLDITLELGKLTNATAFEAVQGYGLLLPQFNFFLSDFDIDEPDTPFLSVPRDKFSFVSNDTVVAEINMGSSKKNYILHNSTEDVDTVYPSSGGSVHKHAILFTNEDSYFDNPLVSSIFTLRDIVAQDTSFTVQDDMFTMETQNYPVWSGEKIIHDPSLIIYHSEPPEIIPGDGDAIPSYNLPLIFGVTTVLITSFMVRFRRNQKTH
ncbi:MAG: hypothetical protein ACFE94_19445 [Candidatus Hodarchaeota archaeon]